MVINTASEYVDFFVNLNMSGVSLLSFVHNERMSLKHRLEYKNQDVESVKNGILILEGLIRNITAMGERKVIEKYGGKNEQRL